VPSLTWVPESLALVGPQVLPYAVDEELHPAAAGTDVDLEHRLGRQMKKINASVWQQSVTLLTRLLAKETIKKI
jgi:hypothetical protein